MSDGRFAERKALYRAIRSLGDEDQKKALSYVSFLRFNELHKDRAMEGLWEAPREETTVSATYPEPSPVPETLYPDPVFFESEENGHLNETIDAGATADAGTEIKEESLEISEESVTEAEAVRPEEPLLKPEFDADEFFTPVRSERFEEIKKKRGSSIMEGLARLRRSAAPPEKVAAEEAAPEPPLVEAKEFPAEEFPTVFHQQETDWKTTDDVAPEPRPDERHEWVDFYPSPHIEQSSAEGAHQAEAIPFAEPFYVDTFEANPVSPEAEASGHAELHETETEGDEGTSSKPEPELPFSDDFFFPIRSERLNEAERLAKEKGEETESLHVPDEDAVVDFSDREPFAAERDEASSSSNDFAGSRGEEISTNFDPDAAEDLKRIRKILRLTLGELAWILSVNVTTLCRWFKDEAPDSEQKKLLKYFMTVADCIEQFEIARFDLLKYNPFADGETFLQRLKREKLTGQDLKMMKDLAEKKVRVRRKLKGATEPYYTFEDLINLYATPLHCEA